MFTTPKHSGRSSLGGITPLSSSFLGRRSLQPTPKTTPTIATRSARAECTLEETDRHVVKELNYPVPVQVQEALRTYFKAASISLHDSGWAWLVANAKLFLWRYTAHQLSVQCYQLSLTDNSGWHSDLITVCSPTSDTQLSLLACSPSGYVSYWSNVLRDVSVTAKVMIDTGDSVVFSVSSLPGEIGCLVATSNSFLFLVTPSSQTGLSTHQLQLPHGMLSGFSRRMSSLLFGAQESGGKELRRVCVSSRGASTTGLAFVLTSTNLQKWIVNASGEQLLYDVELVPLLKTSVLENSWLDSSATDDDIDVWIVDMQMSGGSVAVLFALHCQGTPKAEHGLALIKYSVDKTPVSLDGVLRLQHTLNYPAGQEHLLSEYCLHGTPFSTAIMMYDKNLVLLADIQCSSVESADVINFSQPNCILGAGCLSGNLLFFTLHHGIVSISQTNVSAAKTVTTATPRHHSLLVPTPTLTPNPMPSPFPTSSSSLTTPEASSDAIESIKNAFSFYLEGNMVNACSTCEQHFPLQSFASRLDTQGDLAVICLSQLVLDDPPPSVDPDSPGSGGSLILIYRLEEKFQAHARYVQFLIDVGMMERLTCVCVRGHPMPTRMVLCEHAEKIQAAITLRRMHNPVVDQAVRMVLQRRPPSPYLSLSKNDVFYTHVSKFEDIFPALLACQNEALHSMESAQERVELILSVSSLLESAVRDAVVYRQTKGALYQVSSDNENVDPEFVAWTASEGERGIRHCISEQLDVIVEVGVHEVQRPQDQGELWSLYFNLCDLLYDGYSTQLSSLENLPAMKSRLNEVMKKFEAVRQRFLTPLLKHGQLQHVTELAEKYRDFPVLIQLCEELGNKLKLKEYMSLYAAQGFADFLFKHYLDQGKFHKLLSFSTDFPQELSAFLEPHDNLSWLHHISVQNYSKAHKVLHEMARKEALYVGKKKTLLSLSKLAALASGGGRNESVQEIDNELQYIAYQQNLPKEAIEIDSDDGDPEILPPFSPQKIVELYVGENNPNNEVSDFFAALEFIDFIHNDENDSEIEELRVYIWGQAVLKDDWTQLSTDDPLSELQKTFFFKIVGKAFEKDMDMLALLPNIHSLMSCPQLVEVGLNLEPGFQFLMKAGYEQVERVQSHSTS